MSTQKLYDYAFSCAEEDLPVANKIAAALRERNISYYLYTEYIGENPGKNLFKVSLDVYTNGCKYILMLISETYIKKHWSDLENQMAQTIHREDDDYIIPIRLADVEVNGISKNVVYLKWSDNADEIADLLKKKIESYGKQIKLKDQIPALSIHAMIVQINQAPIKIQNNHF